jgi:hypothetical protein
MTSGIELRPHEAETWALESWTNLHVNDLHATLSHSAKPLLRIELIIGVCRILLTLCEKAEPSLRIKLGQFGSWKEMAFPWLYNN